MSICTEDELNELNRQRKRIGKPDLDNREVILPMTVNRRFDCILADTKQAVVDKYKSVKTLSMKDILLTRAHSEGFG